MTFALGTCSMGGALSGCTLTNAPSFKTRLWAIPENIVAYGVAWEFKFSGCAVSKLSFGGDLTFTPDNKKRSPR